MWASNRGQNGRQQRALETGDGAVALSFYAAATAEARPIVAPAGLVSRFGWRVAPRSSALITGPSGSLGGSVPVGFGSLLGRNRASLIQDAFRPRSEAVTRWRTRLVLCGSALSVMRGLLAGTAPLRGRASLEPIVHPFGFRQAAEFWGIDDWDVAARLHAVVGGTPAYRR